MFFLVSQGLSFRLIKQTNKNIVDTTFKTKLQHNFQMKKMLKKEILIDYSLSCICNVSVIEFWRKFNKWYASWIQDVEIKWSEVWALKGKFSSTFLKIQSEIKKYLQFFLWLLQLTVFILVFVTRKSLNSLHIFLCGMRSCET